MGNWYGTARSNYVRVKDAGAFRVWAATLPGVDVVQKGETFALLVSLNSHTGGWPTEREGEIEPGHAREIDVGQEIVSHLVPGEVFIFCECGAEKLRYLTGWATAVDDTGRMLHISIEDIYALVRKRWKRTPTLAIY